MNFAELRLLLQKAIANGISTPSFAESEFLRYASTKESISNELLDYFKAEENLKLFDDKFYNIGFGWMRVTLQALLHWTLWTSAKEGPDAVIERLGRYLSLDHSPALHVLAVSGLELDKPINLCSGISLIPFSLLPPSQTKSIVDPPHLRPENILKLSGSPLFASENLEHIPKAALVKQIQLRPRSIEEAEINMNPRVLDTELLEICGYLTLLGTCTALPIASWYELEDWVPLYGFLGHGFSRPMHDILNSSSYKLSQEDEPILDSIVSSFRALDQKTRDKLKIPIQRLNQARRRRDLADKAIDIGIAFESLYFSDQQQKEQISLTFSLRAAWFLGNTSDREILKDKFRAIYDTRSTAVHSGKLPPSIKVRNIGAINTEDFLRNADEMCTRSIRRILEQGQFPNWNRTILGLN